MAPAQEEYYWVLLPLSCVFNNVPLPNIIKIKNGETLGKVLWAIYHGLDNSKLMGVKNRVYSPSGCREQNENVVLYQGFEEAPVYGDPGRKLTNRVYIGWVGVPTETGLFAAEYPLKKIMTFPESNKVE